jgi:hypothetical protein
MQVGLEYQIETVLKTQCTATRPVLDKEGRVKSVITRKFRVDKDGQLFEMSQKYNPDTLHQQNSKLVLQIRNERDLGMNMRIMQSHAQKFANKNSRTSTTEDVLKLIKAIKPLVEERSKLEHDKDTIAAMKDGEVRKVVGGPHG